METHTRNVTWGMALRMGADALMIQVSLMAGLAARLLYLIAVQDLEPEGHGELISSYISTYCQCAWPLTLVTLAIFFFMGIYTYGRFYQGRYRALLVFQAVTQSYLTFWFVTNFFLDNVVIMPRSALLVAWIINITLSVGSRVWARLWEKIIHPERQALLSARRGPERQILVIGGAGYIGSALLENLLDAGHRVRLLDLMVFGDEPIKNVANHPNLEVMHGDFRHVENVVEAIQGCDTVIHLGAIVGDPACALDEDLTIDVNLSATRMIGELAKAAGIERFIFASTCSVYGACDEWLDERSMTRPISLYGQTKLASERVLWQMATDRFKPTVVRFSTIYGLSGRTRFDLVVNLLTAKAKIEGKITVFGGDQWRPFVHVEDAAAAVARIVEAPIEIVGSQIFNVGSDEQNYTITQVGELVHQQVVGAELLINTEDSDKRNYRVRFNKIKNQLGFEPKWTVERGIQQVLDAIANGDVENYQDAKYSNVKFLTEVESASVVRGNWARQLLDNLQQE